ncbi:MAG: PEP-CTERM sorting domain-containing protein [Burkholderiales bacterium]
MNPFTGVDDGLTAAFVSPLIFEVDVIGRAALAAPEPSTVALFSLALVGLGFSRRRKLHQ